MDFKGAGRVLTFKQTRKAGSGVMLMGGLEFVRLARAVPGFRFTPILTLTTENEAFKRAEGKRAGATGRPVKPVAGADLVKVIKQVLPGA